MDTAIISPIKYLNQFDQAFPTRFHICYISLVYEYKQYRDFYKSRSKRGDYVILDFSHKTPRDIPQRTSLYLMRSAIEYIKPSAVILPDSDLHLKKTVKSAKETIEFFQRKLGEVPVIGMIQGINEEQYGDCLEVFKQISMDYPLKGIALPASMEKVIPRHKFITDIYQPWEFGLPLYISEVFEGMREVRAIKGNELIQENLVQGGWSTLPARLAYQGKPLSSVGIVRPMPDPLTYLEDYVPDQIVENIECYLDTYNGRG